jgi:2-polyprenyl-6-methoxyphenol hydroxylase-like FAD-dependent oxidoreductase
VNYDAIIIGGGLAGSVIGKQLAQNGKKVLILERENKFKDRVRGENMLPWGVAAARRLGILEDLLAAGAKQPAFFTTYFAGREQLARDLKATTRYGETQINIYHPDLQEALLQRAIKAGAEVIRQATVMRVESRAVRNPTVTYQHTGNTQNVTARVVIGADGRSSLVRTWCGFEVQRDPEFLIIAGVLIGNTDVPDNSVHLFFGGGTATLFAPLGNKRSRVYVVYPGGVTGRRSLSGHAKFSEFVELSQNAGAPTSWFANVELLGPLAEFSGADQWVDSPAKNRVVLAGDSAAASDPSWGSGLALTVVDAEHLTNALNATDDWDAAINRYAAQHDEYFGALHRILSWIGELFWSVGPEADARRSKVLTRMEENPEGFPDNIGLGPFGPSDERARRLMLGLE